MTAMDTSAQNKAAELVEEGVAALISGRKAQARKLLGQALEVDSHSEKGWLWLSGAVDADEERRFCLRQVLSINKDNPAAQKGLRELGPGFARSPIAPLAPTAQPEPPTPAVKPEPPAGKAPAWSEWRQETDSTEAIEAPLPKAWLVVAAILVAGLIVGLAVLFVINTGILGK
ncbi:MAG: hypothetical protein JXM73_07110 [Anaerolineae bacterium]|nr:hypothetical protein [Anaerolineae bacterium]